MDELTKKDLDKFESFLKDFPVSGSFIKKFKKDDIYPSHPRYLFKKLQGYIFLAYNNSIVNLDYKFFDEELEQARERFLIAGEELLNLKCKNFIFSKGKTVVLDTVRYTEDGSYSKLCSEIDELKNELISSYDGLICIASKKFNKDYIKDIPVVSSSNQPIGDQVIINDGEIVFKSKKYRLTKQQTEIFKILKEAYTGDHDAFLYKNKVAKQAGYSGKWKDAFRKYSSNDGHKAVIVFTEDDISGKKVRFKVPK